MRTFVVALALASCTHACLAAPTPAPVRAEIDAVLGRLQASGCEFNRNGSWYKAAEAKTHLLRKLEYLEGNTTLQSTEQFIELGASTSSLSGQPYLVKCGNTAPVESKKWLSTPKRLGAHRGR